MHAAESRLDDAILISVTGLKILSGIGQSTYTVKLLGNLYLVGHVHATSLHVEGGKPSCACGTGWAVSV